MKALKIIGAVLLVLVLAFVGIALIAPTHVHVERSVNIDAPQDFVWSKVNTLDGMSTWSPWVELDPDQVTSIEGTDGSVGAIYSWKGDENVGSGTQEITEVGEGVIKTKLHFIEPFDAEADASVILSEGEDGMVKATWTYDADSPFPMNAMNMFMNMDDMLGPDFQKGVDNLKVLVEEDKKNRTSFSGFEVQRIEVPNRTIVGVRQTISWDEMEAFYEENLGKAYGAAMKAGMEPQGMPCGVYFKWDEENQQAELLAGAPLATGSELEGFDGVEVGGDMLLIEYYGPYEGTAKAHEAMEMYIDWHKIEYEGPVVEEYVTDPMDEPDQSKWLTKIYYSI